MKPRDTVATELAKTETTNNTEIKRHKYPLNSWSFEDGMFFFESGLLLTTHDDFDYTGSTLQGKKKTVEEEWPIPNEVPSLKK